MYDIIIIGAGPAGATAGILAAKKGYKVALLDKAVFPRDKICGDQIIVNALDILVKEGMDIGPLLKKAIMVGSLQYTTHLQNFSFDLRESPVKSLSCKREVFDDFLFKEAQKSVATCYEGIKNLNITGQPDHYDIEFLCGDETTKLQATYVIGADGATSFIRRNYFKNVHLTNAIATRSYVNYTGNKVFMRCYCFPEIESGGYFWIFPVDEKTANCGVILFTDDWKKHFKSLNEVHFHYAKQLEAIISYPEKMDTWQTPFLLSEQELVSHRMLLVGDAAGLVNPMFGHGIDAAIVSAKTAIDHIDEDIRSKKDRLSAYSKEIFDLFASKYMVHEKFRNEGMKVDEGFAGRLQNYFTTKENITLS